MVNRPPPLSPTIAVYARPGGTFRKLASRGYFPIFLAFALTGIILWVSWAWVAAVWAFITLNGQVSAVFATALVASIIAIWGIQSQRAIARRQRTIDLILDHDSDHDVISARLRFLELSKAGGLAEFAEIEKISTPDGDIIRRIVNSYEIISIGIQHGVLDFDAYSMWAKSSTIKVWYRSEDYVKKIRVNAQNQLIYHEFEALVRLLEQNQRPPPRGYRLKKWF